jgi:serine phosphatase RsbU (regulator of sigma subunit)/ligand-binding sensor domain-containing protein
MRRAYILYFLVLFSQIAWSQIYQPVERYTHSDGLSDKWITCLHQDKSGFLWIGTSSGLNRFDGESFRQYYANFNDSTTLASHFIQKIAEDQQGNVWCATNYGISKLAVSRNSFYTYYPYADSANKTLSYQIKDIAIDKERNQMFILTDESLLRMDLIRGTIQKINTVSLNPFSRGSDIKKLTYNADDDALYIYSDNLVIRYSVSTDTMELIFGDMIRRLTSDGGVKGIYCGIGGECWLYTGISLWKINNSKGLNAIKLPSINTGNTEIISVYQRNPEELCIVTNHSVVGYDLQSSLSKVFMKYDLLLTGKYAITSFFYMNDDIFWFGTNQGLFKINYHRQLFSASNFIDYKNKIPKPAGIAYDSNGFLWIASNDGEMAVIDPRMPPGQNAVQASSNLKNRVYSLKTGSEGSILAATDNGLLELKMVKNQIQQVNHCPGMKVESFCCENQDTIWFSSGKRIFLLVPGNEVDSNAINLDSIMQSHAIDLQRAGNSLFILEKYQVIKYNLKNARNNVLSLSQLDLKVLPENVCFQHIDTKELIIGTSYGAFIFYLYDFKVLPNYLNAEQMIYPVQSMILDKNKKIWFSTSKGLFSYDRTTSEVRIFNLSDGLAAQQYDDRLAAIGPDGELCFSGKESLIRFNPDSIIGDSRVSSILFIQAILMGRRGQRSENLIGMDTLVVDTKFSQLLFHIAALDFWDPSRIKYKYSLSRSGEEEEWVELLTKRSFYISGLRPGEYVLKIKATNRDMKWNDNASPLVIKVIAPLLRSRIAILCYAVIFLILFYLSILFTTRQLRNLNRQYREREIIAKEVELQKEELTQKNKNITDSINYAKRIQMALMPSSRLFKKYFSDSFILHIPKDIVSGDFYWVNEVDGRVYFAAVDCTGHGVPGAFMSIIGFELFRRITEIEKKKQPAEILNSLSLGFETIFRDIEDITLRDGMDAAFCAIDPELKLLEFSGAFNPLYLVRDNSITEIKGDRFSVGLNHAEDELPPQLFKDNVIPLLEGDVIYIFTDGYADQFGGPEGKKYKYRRFRHLLLALHQLPMDRQLEFLRRSIMDWKGNLDQVDDILVMGIRIHHKN